MAQAQAVPLQTVSSVPAISPAKFIDNGRVKIGGACRLVTPSASVQFADTGKVKIGGGCRLPNR